MTLATSERRLRAQIAAHTGWANTVDRAARTQPGRDGMSRKIERQLIERVGQTRWAAMTPADQEKAVESARKAYFSALALKASKSRRARREAADAATRARVMAVSTARTRRRGAA